VRRLAAALAAAVVLPVATFASVAQAQLQTRPATLTWDKNVLRGSFSFKDAIDDEVTKRLRTKGLPVTLVMRGYVYPNGGGDPVALTVRTCRVVFELWNELYTVVVNGTVKMGPYVNMKGVYRACTEIVDLPIVERSLLKAGAANYFLAVKVEVNPISEAMQKAIQGWITRPLGPSGAIGAGDALFATFVGVFMKKQVGTADKVVEFRTALFPP
jgi:hypothetical protein